MENLSGLDEALLREIRAIEGERRAKSVEPIHALYRDLHRRVDEALNRLYKAGMIRVGDTINDRYISSTTNPQNG